MRIPTRISPTTTGSASRALRAASNGTRKASSATSSRGTNETECPSRCGRWSGFAVTRTGRRLAAHSSATSAGVRPSASASAVVTLSRGSPPTTSVTLPSALGRVSRLSGASSGLERTRSRRALMIAARSAGLMLPTGARSMNTARASTTTAAAWGASARASCTSSSGSKAASSQNQPTTPRRPACQPAPARIRVTAPAPSRPCIRSRRPSDGGRRGTARGGAADPGLAPPGCPAR